MATHFAFGKIVTDGLILALDAGDRNSYVSGSTTWFDLSGNNLNGVLANSPTFDSANNGSIVFNGSNTYVSSSNNALLNPSTAITIETWFNISSFGINGYAPIILKQNNFNSSFEQYGLFLTSTLIGFYITGVDRVQKAATSNLDYRNRTTHAIGTCDTSNDEMKLYINGNLITTTAFTSTFDISTNSLSIGGTSGPAATAFPGYSNGKIYNVHIYNRVLSALEVLQNYNAQKSRFGLT
jgi:hypothetical protein